MKTVSGRVEADWALLGERNPRTTAAPYLDPSAPANNIKHQRLKLTSIFEKKVGATLPASGARALSCSSVRTLVSEVVARKRCLHTSDATSTIASTN